MERRYKAFISYSWSDKDWGAWLHRTLELYRTPKGLIGAETPLGPVPRRLHPIFKDREEEAAGAGIGAAIEEALDHSDFLIVLCSPRSAKSKWVNREIAYFKTHRNANKILALIVDGEPGASLAGDEENECFPKTLLYKVDDDFQPTDELEDAPLAADARKTGDGKRLAKLKLAAALLGVGLDDLVKRDERRRNARRRLATAASLTLAAVMTGLSFVAVKQRDAAIAAELRAEAAQADAEKRRDQAEGLVEFMITDMRDRLDAVGRLDVLDTTARRTLDYYGEQDAETLDPDALGRRARAQLLLGEVHNTRGDLDAALAAYTQAAATTEEQLKRDPDNEQRIFDHAQSVFWVGYIAWQRGDADKARDHFNQYHEHAKRLVELDPENDDWQAELEYSYSNLGTLEMDEGNAAAAEGHFRNSLAVSTRLVESNPEDIERSIAAGQSLAWLEDSLFRQMKFEEALDQRLSEISLYYKALEQSPKHTVVLSRKTLAHEQVASILLAKNTLQQAHKQAVLASNIAGELVELEPENTEWIQFSTIAHATLGEILMHLGTHADARREIHRALSLSEQLIEKDDSIAVWMGDFLTRPKLLLARVEFLEGNQQNSIDLIAETTSVLEQIINDNMSDSVIVKRYCTALLLSNRINGDLQQNWKKIVELLEPNRNSSDPESVMILTQAYLSLNRTDDAREFAQLLFRAGYRHPDFLQITRDHPHLLIAKNSHQPISEIDL